MNRKEEGRDGEGEEKRREKKKPFVVRNKQNTTLEFIQGLSECIYCINIFVESKELLTKWITKHY